MSKATPYEGACTRSVGVSVKLTCAFVVFVLAFAIISALEDLVFKKRYSNVTGIVSGIIMAVITYIYLGRLRGLCKAKELYEYYTETQKAPSDVARMLVRQHNNVYFTFLLMIWIYLTSRTS